MGHDEVLDIIHPSKFPARHVLIISDSCYAGVMARGDVEHSSRGIRVDFPSNKARLKERKLDNYYQRLLEPQSRYILTSGNREEVSDNSVFIEEVLNRLSADQLVFSANELAAWVGKPVHSKSGKMPVSGELSMSGRRDGNFVFVQTREIPPSGTVVFRVVPPDAGIEVVSGKYFVHPALLVLLAMPLAPPLKFYKW